MPIHTSASTDTITAGATVAALVFTDIAGSTRRWARDPVAMSRILRDHDRLIGEVARRHQSRIFKHTGDGVCLRAPDADRAVQVAEGVLRIGPHLGIHIRAAVHFGPVEARDGDYFGLTLSEVARILEISREQQVLVSASAVAALRTRWRLRRLGPHPLRDLPRPVMLYELVMTAAA